jgi:hypothetical protein
MYKAIVKAKYSFFKCPMPILFPVVFGKGDFCLKSDSLLATNINLVNTLFQMRSLLQQLASRRTYVQYCAMK